MGGSGLCLRILRAAGGGWQDQVGGLVPGIKIGRSEARLPLRVEVEEILVPEGFARILSDHLLLVYTGKTRLARNLLQVKQGLWLCSPSVHVPLGRGCATQASRVVTGTLVGQGDRLQQPGLLQDVVRNWYARLPSIVQNADALVNNAEECARALRQGVSSPPCARLSLLTTEAAKYPPESLWGQKLGQCRVQQLEQP